MVATIIITTNGYVGPIIMLMAVHSDHFELCFWISQNHPELPRAHLYLCATWTNNKLQKLKNSSFDQKLIYQKSKNDTTLRKKGECCDVFTFSIFACHLKLILGGRERKS
jgi:hypothetical protein